MEITNELIDKALDIYLQEVRLRMPWSQRTKQLEAGGGDALLVYANERPVIEATLRILLQNIYE